MIFLDINLKKTLAWNGINWFDLFMFGWGGEMIKLLPPQKDFG